MKDFDLAQVFCEVLSGLAGILLVVGALDATYLMPIGEVSKWLTTELTFTEVTGIFLIAYFIGLVVDAFGLLFDKAVIDRWEVVKTQDLSHLGPFYRHAPEHVFGYWKEQWTYFSCYRNLLMCLLPGTVVWSYVFWRHRGVASGIVVFVIACALALALWVSMRELMKIYWAIPGRFKA
jgi:hypothetical protein